MINEEQDEDEERIDAKERKVKLKMAER